MCGAEENLYKCKIEDTILQVCKSCGRHGTIIEEVKKPQPKKELPRETIERNTIIQVINPNYHQIIKNRREELGLKQKELGQIIAEKESLIHKIESGHLEPSMSLARKLERFLKITLVQQHEERSVEIKRESDDVVTLGDIIKIRKRS